MGWYHADLKRRARIILEEKLLVKRTIKRTSDMPCLLCKKNKADKTNSHIIPRFLGKDIFNKSNEAYTISSAEMNEHPAIVQSSPKESHILCAECEAYFSVIETSIANGIYKDLWDDKKKASFTLQPLDENAVVWTSKSTDPKQFHLFIYSIVWRMFVTSNVLFKHFKASDKLIDALRLCLIAYKGTNANDFVENLSKVSIPMTPSKYLIHTCEVIVADGTTNSLAPIPRANPYYIFINRWTLMISFRKNDHQEVFKESNNVVPSDDKIKIVKFKEAAWEAFRQKFLWILSQNANQGLQRKGALPFDYEPFLEARKKRKPSA